LRKPDVDLRSLEDLLVRLFGSLDGLSYERTPTGTSTQVYRLRCGDQSFYLRVAEEPDASLAPEVEAHRMLHASGVRVPAVTHYEPFDDALGRSVMVVTEIAGAPLDGATPARTATEVLRAAGRDLAKVHSVPVHGFGWVRREHREPGWPLRGEHETYADFVDPDSVAGPLVGIGFSVHQADQVVRLLEEAVELGPDGATGALAHGDFDASHIFTAGDAYTGLIDFGEIRGTDYTFDFATLCLNVDSGSPSPAVRRVVEQGYADVRSLPADHERRVYLACVLSASHRLAGWYRRDGERAADGWFFRWIRDCLVRLLKSGRAPL
jgi:aminoglycoside phosphotransferase (APT) family kinase protein